MVLLILEIVDDNLGEIEFLDVWDDAYAAIMRYSRAADGYWVRQNHFSSRSIY